LASLAHTIDQGSRLSTTRLARNHEIDFLEVGTFDDDSLYNNLDWLNQHQFDAETNRIMLAACRIHVINKEQITSVKVAKLIRGMVTLRSIAKMPPNKIIHHVLHRLRRFNDHHRIPSCFEIMF
jgi:hypothetical protein